ncbi:unnamed protein product, partial [Didymodactylos carnosus]
MRKRLARKEAGTALPQLAETVKKRKNSAIPYSLSTRPQSVRADNDEYNSRLLALYDDIDVINVAFDENMPLRDGIHLNSCDTKELQK